jgi:transcriptional regulator with XRE-family HTH domain
LSRAYRTASARAADSTDAAVGRNIRIERLARRMSQTDLAEQIGITFQQVQKYEKGTNRVGSGRLARIAEAFGLPISALFGGTPASRRRGNEPSALHLIAEKSPLRLVQAFARIKDRSLRRSIVAMVENVAAKCAE